MASNESSNGRPDIGQNQNSRRRHRSSVAVWQILALGELSQRIGRTGGSECGLDGVPFSEAAVCADAFEFGAGAVEELSDACGGAVEDEFGFGFA